MANIFPSVGRNLHYVPSAQDAFPADPHEGVCLAFICAVENGQSINVLVVDALGNQHKRHKVRLYGPDETVPGEAQGYCKWMPYQAGQAQKAAQLAGELEVQKAINEARLREAQQPLEQLDVLRMTKQP